MIKKKYDQEKKNNKEKPEKEPPNYLTINSQPPQRPSIKLCGVCGFKACYTCIQCKSFYCSLSCKETHTETRCMKV